MNRFGATFGMGLPIALNRNAPENLFRFSLGFSFSDIWFGKRKYD